MGAEQRSTRLSAGSSTGLTTFEEITKRRFPLLVHTRRTPRHTLQFMVPALLRAAGFSVDDLAGSGGAVAYDGGFPFMHSKVVEALRTGELEALFEEGCDEWLPVALERGMTILGLSDATIAAAEKVGFRRAVITRTKYPQLLADVQTVSFSG